MLEILIFSIYSEADFKDFLNVANEEKFRILDGKLFQIFTTRSQKSFFPRVCAAVVNLQPHVAYCPALLNIVSTYCARTVVLLGK